MTETGNIEEKREKVSKILSERLEAHDESRRAAQEKLHNFCEGLRAQINTLEERVNSELEEKFKAEDNRLQDMLNELRPDGNDGDVSKAIQKAKTELLVMQSYEVVVRDLDEDEGGDKDEEEDDDDDEYEEEEEEDYDDDEYAKKRMKKAEGDGGGEPRMLDLASLCELRTERKVVSMESIDFEERKPRSLIPSFTEKGELSLSFTFFDEDEVELLKEVDSHFEVKVEVWAKGHEKDTSRTLTKELILGSGGEPICLRSTFPASTAYRLKMRIVHQGMSTQWSDETEFTTPEFKECCVWKECPENVYWSMKYSVDEENPRIATKIGDYGYYCTIIGNTPLPPNTVTSWRIKILKSKDNDGGGIFIGVAPFDIDQNEDLNYDKCGWYFYCYDSILYSGPPHDYKYKEYGPWKGNGKYVHTGDSVGVAMDTTKGELSFVVNGVNLGVAYDGIPLDKPLVPCVILYCDDDSVELDTSEVKENVVDSSIPIPSNITTKNGITWDSITLTWNGAVEGASFYQIEVDGNKSWGASTKSTFMKRGLLAETEHTFRVRAVRGKSVSEWSDVVKGETEKESFETSGWKECPDNVDEKKKYSVGEENPRIATKIGDDWCYCTIIGNTPLPLNTVTSWSIKILKSEGNDGGGIFIGVAPSDIDQNVNGNFNKCGWYFGCYDSELHSGPPHNYRGKEYGPRKGDGEYVHTGDSVGVVMDTAKGKLSFILDGVNLGVAYDGIPLDKPLVPCVILYCDDDSVELDTSEVRETVDSSIPIPSNITTKNGITWDTITLTWNDAVEGASFYQIEVDGSKSWGASTKSTFTKRGLLPETEHTFRVRAVRGNSVSEWSGAVKGRAQKAPEFGECVWKECPDNVDEKKKYSVDEENPRIATKICGGGYYCTIIGNTPLPPNKVTSWSIKILKSEENNGWCIFIGVAPFDIDQNEEDNRKKCGWYFHCQDSTLFSGPPHNCKHKEYGPRKGDGEYVHTGDSVGVVMDTAKGELSFVVNGVNLGVAFKGIPLDKPLVPCVVLGFEGDSVELVI